MSARRLTRGLLALLKKRRLDRELEDEILAHLELAERDAVARGLSPEEARRDARRSFGGIAQVREEHRDRRGLPWIETVARDLRYGLAALVRVPGFTSIVVSVLALGIGANVAMFSIVESVLFKPLPFPEPDRIVAVWEAPRPGVSNATSAPDFLDWRRLATDFEGLSAEKPVSAATSSPGGPVRLSGKAVTADYFRVFGVSTLLGRVFAPEEVRPGSARVMVLSFAAWQTRFGGDPGILGRQIPLDGEPHRVVGVLQRGAFDRDGTQFWKPLVFTSDQLVREIHWLTVYGRLRSGVTLERAGQQMQAIHTALRDLEPPDNREWTIVVERLSRLLVGANLQRSISVAFGAVGLVLLIACANVAALLLARGATERKELAIRTALGASRARLVSRMLTESLVLCLFGGAAGSAVASLLIRVAKPVLSQVLPFTADVRVDPRVLGFAAAVSLAVALVAGAIPALETSFGNLAEALNRMGRGASGAHARVRRGIVIGEVALSLMLVCGALLLFRSLLKLQRLDTGVRIENVMTMSLDLPASAYPTPQRAALFYQALVERLHSVPGIVQAAVSTHLPLQWISNGEGLKTPGAEGFIYVRFKRVDPGYFGTLGIPVLRGRGISGRDREGTPRVIVINQALSARLAEVAGMTDPIGKTVRLTCPGYIEKRVFMPEVEIVGMIRSERVAFPGAPDPPVVYVPLAQVPAPGVRLIVRSRTEAAALVPAIRAAVHEIDPSLPLEDVAAMEQVWKRTLWGSSRPAWLVGGFAGIAVLLTGVGLYGVLAHSVTQRRREIGIRMALGAGSPAVISHVLWNALFMVTVGLALGLAGAVALTRVLKSMLFEVSPLDPAALGLSCVCMTLIGLVAGVLPASRAARVDPVTTLREEG
ncbi:MAG TPA: ABC transporter permease [Bryobacteraceae bacterium]|nr:ABC transporter permease [Bryobacteraceae bacterium]